LNDPLISSPLSLFCYGHDPFASTLKTRQIALPVHAHALAFQTLFSRICDRNHAFAEANCAGNPGAGIDTRSFTKSAWNRRLHNLNLASSIADVTGGEFRRQINQVFPRATAKSAFYLHIASFSLPEPSRPFRLISSCLWLLFYL
jgi:hypothetical protein